MKVSFAVPSDVPLILTFIKKKSEFDRNIGAYFGKIEVTEEKLHKTIFTTVPFAYVLFAENAEHAVGFALYGFRYSSFAVDTPHG